MASSTLCRCRAGRSRRRWRHPAVVAQVGALDALHEALEDGVAVAGDEHVAVAARIGVGRGDARQRGAGRLAHGAEHGVLGQQALAQVEDALVERGVDDLPLPAARIALVQGQQHPHGAVQAGNGVAQRQAGAHRCAAGLAVEIAQPRHGFADGGKAGLLRLGAGLAVARDAQHDQTRVEGVQRLPRQAPFLHGAGAEVLDQHVGLGGQLARQVLALGLAQVHAHGLLVARLRFPPDRSAFMQQAPLAQRVALPGRLDLDDLRAEVGQRLGGKGPRDQLPELQHPYAGQYLPRHVVSVFVT
ncbi:Uncharacterised protein [Bordetella pertussis]|nr:Uncharacterised protein [Bordetella pertussis]